MSSPRHEVSDPCALDPSKVEEPPAALSGCAKHLGAGSILPWVIMAGGSVKVAVQHLFKID